MSVGYPTIAVGPDFDGPDLDGPWAAAPAPRRRWARIWPALLVLALTGCLFGTAALFVRSQPDTYTSTAVLSLLPRDPVQVGSDDLLLATSRYVAYLAAPATRDRVGIAVGYDAANPAGKITVLQQPGTVNIEVTVTGRLDQAAASMANALAAEGVRASVVDAQVEVQLIVPAVVAAFPSGPPRKLLLLGGAGAALLVALFSAIALTRRP